MPPSGEVPSGHPSMESPPPRDTASSQSSAVATSASAALGDQHMDNPFAPKSPFSVFGTNTSPFNAVITPGLQNSVFVFSSGKELGSSAGHPSHFLSSTVDATSTSAFSAASTSLIGASSSCQATDSRTPGLGSSEITASEITASVSMSTSPFDASRAGTLTSGSSALNSSTQGLGSSGTAAFGVSSQAVIPPPVICRSAKSSSCFGGQTYQFGRFSSRIKKCLGLDKPGTSITPDTRTVQHVVELMSISAMPQYKDKTHEELRYEDYKLRNKVWRGLLRCRRRHHHKKPLEPLLPEKNVTASNDTGQ